MFTSIALLGIGVAMGGIISTIWESKDDRTEGDIVELAKIEERIKVKSEFEELLKQKDLELETLRGKNNSVEIEEI